LLSFARQHSSQLFARSLVPPSFRSAPMLGFFSGSGASESELSSIKKKCSTRESAVKVRASVATQPSLRGKALLNRGAQL